MSSKKNNKIVGNRGECLAAEFLQKAGYAILERKYRTRYGEIDIIAKFGKYVAFVEVKTRLGYNYGRPAAAVDFRKRKKIACVAEQYIQDNELMDCHFRFDVLEIILENDEVQNINHIRGAFEVS